MSELSTAVNRTLLTQSIENEKAHRFVLKKTLKPPIRRLFTPDPGYTIIDADLSGADAQVVAWEADDSELKDAFRNGLKVHAINAAAMFGPAYTDAAGENSNKMTPKGRIYDDCKRFVHATNYIGSARTIALVLGWNLAVTQERQKRWFSIRPGIKVWHRRIDEALRTTRTVTNQFGYRIVYFDRIDAVLPQAVAWGPQSTVAVACFRGGLQVAKRFANLDNPFDISVPVQFLLQVHDSLVFQLKTSHLHLLPEIKQTLLVPIPYPDPLTINWKIAASNKSWGDCKELKL